MTDVSSIELPLDIIAIQKCIPHRFPFLLIDKVIELEPHKKIRAVKNISISDSILQGHFPENPIYPGVLIIEGIAQASAVLGHYSRSSSEGKVLLTEVTKARFKRKVIPGDTLHYEVEVAKTRSPFFWFEGKAFIGDEAVAWVSFSALMK
jgi:3-hydroxyacyl-[acyl-carrier-protein] dehydratase